MTEELKRLWRLHELDEQAAVARAALARFPALRQALARRVSEVRERLAGHVKDFEEQLKARRQFEREIETVTAQLRQYESRQPSVKTNDEFRALTHEIDDCKSKRSDLETQVLLRFEEEESLAKHKPEIERALKTAETERTSGLSDIEREEAAARTRLAGVEGDRAAELAELTPATRQRYERIHASREGRAVVPIVKNACGGCFRGQPPQMLQEIRRGERVLVCDGCGRILIQPPGEA